MGRTQLVQQSMLLSSNPDLSVWRESRRALPGTGTHPSIDGYEVPPTLPHPKGATKSDAMAPNDKKPCRLPAVESTNGGGFRCSLQTPAVEVIGLSMGML